MVFHQRLKATIGLLIFCKVSMNTYVPNSLGDLIETLSKEYDTRSKSKPCKQMDQNQQCNVNRSRSYVQLDRQHSIRENSIMKQPVMRSNSFTYKQHHRINTSSVKSSSSVTTLHSRSKYIVLNDKIQCRTVTCSNELPLLGLYPGRCRNHTQTTFCASTEKVSFPKDEYISGLRCGDRLTT
ncbi:unnamed protein product [Trichobilharzia regenti]|nr:unnamed protein product [Trichobilharzia regenti]